MEFLHDIVYYLKNLDQLIEVGGMAALVAIVFAETGLLAGFFLPGDSLLVTAGLVAATGKLDIWALNGCLSLAAIVGDSVGYAIGYRVGPALFNREDSALFHRDHLIRTQKFFEKYGGKTIVLARFVPIVRTFAPTVAGVGRMPYRRFLFFNCLGGIGWVASMTWIGYSLGRLIPNIDQYLHAVVAVVIVLSFLPILWEWRHHRRQTRQSR